MSLIISFLLLFNTALAISPIFYQFSFLGPVVFLSLITLSILLWFKKSYNKHIKIYLLIIFTTLISFLISSMYWQDFGLVHFSKFFLLSLFIVALIDNKIKHRYITWLSYFIFFQSLLAIIGFIYAAFGGQPVLAITIPSGREFPLYLTSFSVTKYAYFIRPSGLFDEPGALSFLICFVVMLREACGFKRTFNYLILSLGLVTLSLAHLVFLAFYFFYCIYLLRSKKAIQISFISILLVASIIPFIPNTDSVTSYYISRSSSDLGGEGRSGLLNTTVNYLSESDLSVYVWGASSSCLTDYNANCRYVFPRMGENILSPLVFGGLITSWFYYLFAIITFMLALYNPSKYLIPFVFIALFFQRPYMYNISYSLMYVFALSEILSIWTRRTQMKF